MLLVLVLLRVVFLVVQLAGFLVPLVVLQGVDQWLTLPAAACVAVEQCPPHCVCFLCVCFRGCASMGVCMGTCMGTCVGVHVCADLNMYTYISVAT